ncbi:hypothetical protein LEN26_013328 [Aphanomyces euteiches]|nr:hypothetical protein LEN26_013328 [Aphanomyces euteiches]KAH9116490.1 hypothetical protein AeMF1_009581 [Aphanomyces euteiches]KAH9194693.1 hypothetical protein AeNC1_003333 [Aphanomyces euteiches]
MGRQTWSDFLGVKSVLPLFTSTRRESEPEATTCSDDVLSNTDESEANNTAALIEELLDAAKEGNLDTVRRLTEVSEVDPDARGYMGWTAAHWAAREGHIHVLEYLRLIGANMDALDRKGDCLLHKAAANGQHDVCAWLLERNFNVQAVNNNGMTPIDLVREKAKVSRDPTTVQCEALLVRECECTF